MSSVSKTRSLNSIRQDLLEFSMGKKCGLYRLSILLYNIKKETSFKLKQHGFSSFNDFIRWFQAEWKEYSTSNWYSAPYCTNLTFIGSLLADKRIEAAPERVQVNSLLNLRGLNEDQINTVLSRLSTEEQIGKKQVEKAMRGFSRKNKDQIVINYLKQAQKFLSKVIEIDSSSAHVSINYSINKRIIEILKTSTTAKI